MKTAVSIPDALFLAADQLASQLDKSRSQLGARGLSGPCGSGDTASQINEVCDSVYDAASPDAFVQAAAVHALRQIEW